MLTHEELISCMNMNQSLGRHPLSNGSDSDDYIPNEIRIPLPEHKLCMQPTETNEIKAEKAVVRTSLLSVLEARTEKKLDQPF